MNDLELKNFTIGNNEPMTLMGGVNVLESRDLAMQVAEKFKEISVKLDINYIFKGSFLFSVKSFLNIFHLRGNDSLARPLVSINHKIKRNATKQ